MFKKGYYVKAGLNQYTIGSFLRFDREGVTGNIDKMQLPVSKPACIKPRCDYVLLKNRCIENRKPGSSRNCCLA